MNKISGIKKVSKTKHVDVDDQTKEAIINVHDTQLDDDVSVNKKKGQDKKTQDSKDTIAAKISQGLRIIFMGTGSFAARILEEIHKNAPGTVVQIITQPDKKIGRKKSSIHRTLAANPVRDFAKEKDIPLYQPYKLDENALTTIKKMNPSIIIVASYGKILPKKILDIPQFGPINVHASLLPKLRGASPVQNALMLGLKETGITIMEMSEELDTGDIIAQEKISILEHEKMDDLLGRISELGAKLLLDKGPQYVQGTIKPVPQDHSQATMCQLIDREDGHIQWTWTTEEIYNRYRALSPWPGIFGYWEETQNQLMRIKLRAIYPFKNDLTDEQKKLIPGTVFIGADQLCIRTFDSAIIVEAIQPECKTVMPVYDFLNGHKAFEGAVLR